MHPKSAADLTIAADRDTTGQHLRGRCRSSWNDVDPLLYPVSEYLYFPSTHATMAERRTSLAVQPSPSIRCSMCWEGVREEGFKACCPWLETGVIADTWYHQNRHNPLRNPLPMEDT